MAKMQSAKMQSTMAELLSLSSTIDELVQKDELKLAVPTSDVTDRSVDALEHNPKAAEYDIQSTGVR
jgi:hypothetical protein